MIQILRFKGMCTAKNWVLVLAALGNIYLRFKKELFLLISSLHTDNHTQGERV